MRGTLPWIVALVLASAFVFHLLPVGLETEESRGSGGSRGNPRERSRIGPFDRNQIGGEDIVTWVEDRSTIDGRVEVWPRLLLHAGRLQPESEDAFRLDRVLLLSNRRPTNASELTSLLRLDPDRPARVLGEVLRQHRDRLAWFEAPRAVLIGGTSLTDASRIFLRDGVTAGLPADRSPVGAVQLAIPSLTVELTRQEVVRIHSGDRLVLQGDPGRFEGTGLSIDPKSGVVVLERDLVGDLQDPGRISRRAPPLHVEAGGPLRYEPNPAAGDEPSAGGLLSIGGDVAVSWAERGLRAEGGRFTARVEGRRPELREIVLDRGATLLAPFGDISGPTLTLVREPGVPAVITMSGGAIGGTLRGGSRWFAALGTVGDLTWTTPGRVTVEGIDGPDGALTVRIGPGLDLAGRNLTAQVGGYLTIRFVRVADPRADAPPGARTTVLDSVVLDGTLSASDVLGSLRAGSSTYTRHHAENGIWIEESLLLEGDPRLELISEPASPDRSTAPDRFRIESQGRILLRRDPLGAAPLRLEAGPHVDVRWLDGPGPEGLVARLGAAALTATLAETWWDALAPGATVGSIEGRRDVAEFDAAGRVVLTTRNGHRVDAERVHFHRESDLVTISRDRPDAPAEVSLRLDARDHRILTPELRYDLALRRLTADRGVQLFGHLPPIPFGAGAPDGSGLEPTQVRAGRLMLALAVASDALLSAFTREVSLASVGARERVEVGQGPRSAFADSVDLQVDPRNWLVTGKPARLEHTAGPGVEESLKAQIVTGNEELIVAEGVVEGRLALAPLFGGEKGQRVLTTFATPGELRVSPARVSVPRGGTVIQGDPEQRGFRLEGAAFEFELARGEPTDPTGSAGFVVSQAVSSGGTLFRTGRLQAEGESLRYDRARARLWLESTAGRAQVRLDGIVNAPRDVWEIDMTDPDRPRVTARSAGNRDE